MSEKKHYNVRKLIAITKKCSYIGTSSELAELLKTSAWCIRNAMNTDTPIYKNGTNYYIDILFEG